MKSSQFIHTGDFGANIAYGIQGLIQENAANDNIQLECTSYSNDTVDSITAAGREDWVVFLPNCTEEFGDIRDESFWNYALKIVDTDEFHEFSTARDLVNFITEQGLLDTDF